MDGEQGLRILEVENFDLVLLDLALPGQSGLELLPQIKERQPETPVIMITAYGTVENVVEAVRGGRGKLCPEALGQRKADGRHSLGRRAPPRRRREPAAEAQRSSSATVFRTS